MTRRVVWIILLAGMAVLLLGGSALAMLSEGYRLSWLAEGSGGGGRMDSASYAVHVTVGQVVLGDTHSEHYGVRLGFWQGVWRAILLYMPVLKTSP